jgi:hypothetical protein
MDGTFETGDARSQIALALENLEKTVKAAEGDHGRDPGALLPDQRRSRVGAQRGMDQGVKPPYPNGGILIVNAISMPGIVILIQVHAYIEP